MQIDQAFAKLNIVQDFVPAGNSNRPGTRLNASSITIHNTDNTARGANAAAHARYMKGPDAQRRKVSWHYTVDDDFVYQSLPTNEVGWHAASREGNASSIGIEICMNEGLNVQAAYARAALLVAVLARRLGVHLPRMIFQHHDWSGKDCPIVLRHQPNGWSNFVTQIMREANELTDVPSMDIVLPEGDHHHA